MKANCVIVTPLCKYTLPLPSNENLSPLYTNLENSDGTASHPFQNKTLRKRFITRVYLILFSQLLITFSSSLVFNLNTVVKHFTHTIVAQFIYILSIISTIITIGIFMCKPNMAKKEPINYILLVLFTFSMAYLLSLATIRIPTNTLLIATGATTGVTGALTLYAVQTTIDFTVWGSYLLVGLLAILLTLVLNFVFMNTLIYSMISGAGTLVFSGFIVYNTQMIVNNNNRKYTYGTDDYVFAAISLYMDIINLFFYIIKMITCYKG